MREIEFRGKRVNNSEWIYGSLSSLENGNFQICDKSQTPTWWEYVKPETIGQYIGREDKNGVKIYEGDILDAGIEYSGLYGMPVVEIGEYIDCELGDCKLIGANLAFEDDTQTGIISDTIGTFIVIGNIYDKEVKQ